MRKKPDVIWDVITWIYEGTAVTVTEQCLETGWYHVILADGREGYSSANYFTTKVPASVDTSVKNAIPVPDHVSSGSFVCDLGDSPVFAMEGFALTSLVSYDESILTVGAGNVLTLHRAGSTVVSGVSGGSTYFFDVTVLDRHRMDGASVTKREITDDLWLLAEKDVNGTVLARSTGLKISEVTPTGYRVTCGSLAFEVLTEEVTDVCPAVTPTPALPDTNYAIKPGMLVNYDYVLLTTGDPANLVNVMSARTTRSISTDPECMLAADMINAISVLARDCVRNGGSYFIIDNTGAYRTFEMQDGYWKARMEQDPSYGDNPYASGGTKCVPGVSSEHRTGYAADVITKKEGYTWLNENSWKYGFIHRYIGAKTQYTGVMDEYWHYTYVGHDIAETCYKEGLCLEEYYAKYVFK